MSSVATISPSVTVCKVAPISPGQERLLAAEFTLTASGLDEARRAQRLRPGDTQALLIDGPLDVAALSDAVLALVTRQSALRTRFRFPPTGQAIQIVRPALDLPFEVIGRPGTADDEVAGLIAEHGWPMVDPITSDLFAAKLLTLGPSRALLLLSTHHLCSDGNSIGILNAELSELYAARVQRRLPALPPLPSDYADLCVRMRHERLGAATRTQVDFWQSELRGDSTGRRMTYLEAAAPAAMVSTQDVDLQGPWFDRVKRAAGRISAPILAAIALLARAHSGASSINIGCMVANRGWADSDAVIGNFVNIVVIRLTIRPEQTLAELWRQAQQTLAAALAHQSAPIQDVAAAVSDAGSNPHYDITLSLLPPRVAIGLPGVTCRDVSTPTSGDTHGPRMAHTSVTWRWFLEETIDGVRGTLTYDTARFSAAAIARTLRGFEMLLDAMGQDDITIAAIAARLDD